MSQSFCSHCGKPILSIDSKFCSNCGAILRPQEIPQVAAPPNSQPPTTWVVPAPPPQKHTGLIVGIVVIVVLLLTVFAGTWAWGSSAVNGLTLSCISSTSSLGFTSSTLGLMIGVKNPSNLDVSSDWTITIHFPSVTFSSE